MPLSGPSRVGAHASPTAPKDRRTTLQCMVLHNPGAKSGRRATKRLQALANATAPHCDLRWVPLSELASQRDRPDRLIAVGGDGTANLAATWLLDQEPGIELAVVPAGTGNNLARGLGLPLNVEAAFELACTSMAIRPLDVAQVAASGTTIQKRPHLLIQSGALGFPAQIAQHYDTLRERPWLRRLFAPVGPYVYRVLSVGGLLAQSRRQKRGEPSLRVTCQIGDERIDEEVFAIFLGNERSLGGNFIPCPRAKVDDSLLDFCFVRIQPPAQYRKLFRQVVSGRHIDDENAVIYRQSAGPIELQLSAETPLLLDGDLPVVADRYYIQVVPRALEVVVPATRERGGDR